MKIFSDIVQTFPIPVRDQVSENRERVLRWYNHWGGDEFMIDDASRPDMMAIYVNTPRMGHVGKINGQKVRTQRM